MVFGSDEDMRFLPNKGGSMKRFSLVILLVTSLLILSAYPHADTPQLPRSVFRTLPQSANRDLGYLEQQYFPWIYTTSHVLAMFEPAGMIMKHWDGQAWQDAMLWQYIYDDGKMVEMYLTEYEQGQPDQAHIVITYDAEGNIIESEQQAHNGTTWVAVEQEHYTYGPDGLALWTQYTDYGWDEWTEEEQAVMSYTGGYLDGILWKWYDEMSNSWMNEWRESFSYGGGNPASCLGEYWDQSWIPDLYETFTFDASGSILSEIEQYWNGNEWVNDLRYTYTYDRLLHTYMLGETWTGNGWENEEQETVTLLPDGLPDFILGEIWGAGGWQNGWLYTFTYEPAGSGHAVAPAAQWVTNYPNPFGLGASRSSGTTIEFSLVADSPVSIDVYDARGQLVRSLFHQDVSAGRHQVYWDGSGSDGTRCSSGIYFYKIKSYKMECARKMLLIL
jgi:hypothetical protein